MGVTSVMLNDSTCTTRVVPTLAPSMTASAGTRSRVPPVTKEAAIKPGRGAALQKRGDESSGEKGAKPVLQGDSEQAPQVRAERANHTAVDHVQAPEQQRDSAHQIENDCAAHASSYQGSE